jgi:hypothetical protein
MALLVGSLGMTGLLEAAGLGIGLDTFMTTVQTWCVGLGVGLFVVGGVSWLNQKMDMVHMPALSGTMPLIIHGGIFGGIVTIATGLGLTPGATLPLF